MAHYLAYKKMQGLTIVQTMLILLIVGIAGSVLVNYIIDKRCEAEPSRAMCANRQ
jgi:hypothetical protein